MPTYDSCDDIPVNYTEARDDCWETVAEGIASGQSAEAATPGYSEAADEGTSLLLKVFIFLGVLGLIGTVVGGIAMAFKKRVM